MTIEQLDYVAKRLSARDKKDIVSYEFGVYQGNSMRDMAKLFKKNGLNWLQAFGFDSFEGLPKETPGLAVWHDFYPGNFDQTGGGKLSTVEVAQKLQAELRESGIPAYLVAGFFEDSLTDTLPCALGMRPADWVYMDADLYCSTITAWEWLLRNNLMVPNQTIVAYDEWRSANNAGESRAHHDICVKYKVELQEIWTHDQNLVQKTFLYLGGKNDNGNSDSNSGAKPRTSSQADFVGGCQ